MKENNGIGKEININRFIIFVVLFLIIFLAVNLTFFYFDRLNCIANGGAYSTTFDGVFGVSTCAYSQVSVVSISEMSCFVDDKRVECHEFHS